MRRTNAACDLCNQFAVSFGLLSQEIDFVLLIADEKNGQGDFTCEREDCTNKRLVLVRTSRLSQYDLSKLRPAA